MNNFEVRLLDSKPVHLERQDVTVRFMTDDVMGQFFGYALQGTVFVKSSLPSRVKKFVIAHEKFHLQDRRKWLGWFGAEFRANFICGIKDPIGFMATIKSSLTRHRLSLYWNLLIRFGKNLYE